MNVVLHCYDGEPNVMIGDAHAIKIPISQEDHRRYQEQRVREQFIDRDNVGVWVEVTDVETGERWRVATAPCGAGCRCAAVAERVSA